MDVRTLDKEKGERLRTEEEKRQLKEEYETYDAKLFLDPRKVPCWRTAVLGAFGTAASLSALQLLYRIKYAKSRIALISTSTIFFYGWLGGCLTSWFICRGIREQKRQDALAWMRFMDLQRGHSRKEPQSNERSTDA